MNFKMAFIIFFMISCSTKQLPRDKERVHSNEFTNLDKEAIYNCQKKSKAFLYLSKLKNDVEYSRWFTKILTEKKCIHTLSEVLKGFDQHENKIGVLFEKKSMKEESYMSMLEGLSSVDKSRFIIHKIKRKKNVIDRALADLVLNKKVGLIISWGDDKFSHYIKKWQKQLDFPVVFLGNESEVDKNVFKVFPNATNYALKLVLEMKKKGVKKLAFLSPIDADRSNLLKIIKQKIKDSGIEITYEEQYSKDSYESMDGVCRKIFEIDKNKRWDEYQNILNSERQKSNAQGYKLNHKLVFLPAKVDYDAIFIADNFKIVNHFLKIFEYYKMPQISLFGTHEWRSLELAKARSPYLSSAVFIDFIGETSNLPKSLQQDLEGLGLNTDYKLMGYYAGLTTAMAIKVSKNRKSLVTKALSKIKIRDDFFGHKLAFVQNEFNWPSFSFEVQNGQIILTKN